MQHQFIPKVPFTLYHATSTGENLEILRSFASQGINPTIAEATAKNISGNVMLKGAS